jgi:predicted dehydrogenase
MEKRALIAGLGHAGVRFLRACLSVRRDDLTVRVAAVVDSDGRKLATFEELGFPGYLDVARACAAGPIDVAIVTVPELFHCRVIADVKRYHPTITRILCEKRLAPTMAEARMLTNLLANDELTVNFVERFSPIVEDLMNFIRSERRRVVRVNCIWGKYRIKDPRVTPDVLTELSHPLDLVLFLADVPVGTRFQVLAATSAKSNYNTGAAASQALDTVHFTVEFETGLQLIGGTSYLWPQRRRQVELLLTDGAGQASELAVLVFDDPIWDLDRLEIYDVRASGGRPELVYKNGLSSACWPTERLTVGKVCRFLEANLEEIGGRRNGLLPRLDQGVYVQEVLEAIAETAKGHALSLSAFQEPRNNGSVDPTARVDMLSRLSTGRPVEVGEYIWDRLY